MSDALRDRIAAIISRELPGVTIAVPLADVLVRELGLTAEHGHGTTYPRVPVTDVRYTRHVTDWHPDE